MYRATGGTGKPRAHREGRARPQCGARALHARWALRAARRGPNALIFGRGGGGGVLNRVSKEAQWAPIRAFTAEGGSFDQPPRHPRPGAGVRRRSRRAPQRRVRGVGRLPGRRGPPAVRAETRRSRSGWENAPPSPRDTSTSATTGPWTGGSRTAGRSRRSCRPPGSCRNRSGNATIQLIPGGPTSVDGYSSRLRGPSHFRGVHREANISGACARPPRPWHRIRAGGRPTPRHSARYLPITRTRRPVKPPKLACSDVCEASSRGSRSSPAGHLANPAMPAATATRRAARSRRRPSAAGTPHRWAPPTRPIACPSPAPLRAGTTARNRRIAPVEPAGEAGPGSGPRSRRAEAHLPGRGSARPPMPSGGASGSASPARTPWRGRTPGLRRRAREGARLRPGHTARRRSPLFRRQ